MSLLNHYHIGMQLALDIVSNLEAIDLQLSPGDTYNVPVNCAPEARAHAVDLLRPVLTGMDVHDTPGLICIAGREPCAIDG